MLIGPELRALRVCDGPQRDAQVAMHRAIGEWRDTGSVRAVDEALAAFDAGEDFADIPVLAALMTAHGARAYADEFMRAATAALGEAPLAHVALRHTHTSSQSSLLLSQAGRVTLSLQARVARAGGEFAVKTCVLTDIDSWDVVLAGAIEGRLFHTREGRRRVAIETMPLAMRRGDCNARRGRREVLAIDRIDRCFTLLRLQRRAEVAEPARAYELETGGFVRQASADVEDSRRGLMVALLGRMERREDAPVLADIARNAGDCDLRWQAVRECLGLDTATGFRLLGELSQRIGDPLKPDSAALRRDLLERHPQLAALEGTASCPA